MTAVGLGVTWALVAAGFSAVACVRLRRAARVPAAAPPVLLFRPVDAPTPLEEENLRTPIDYPGVLTQVVVSPVRPALAPGAGWLPSDPAAPNRKVGHLAGAIARIPAGRRVVVAVDADVRVDGALLRGLAAPVVAGAALVTAPPEALPAPGVAPRAVRALLGATHHAFRALDAMRAGPPAVCGKAMALGPAALALLPDVADRAGEDLALATALAARGERVVLAAVPARVPQAPHAGVGAALVRFTRWMQVLRAHRPWLYPWVPVLFAPTLPLLLLSLGTRSALLASAVGALCIARAALARRLGAAPAGDWPLGEALLLAAFVRSLGARRLAWRGRGFRLGRGGRMVAAA